MVIPSVCRSQRTAAVRPAVFPPVQWFPLMQMWFAVTRPAWIAESFQGEFRIPTGHTQIRQPSVPLLELKLATKGRSALGRVQWQTEHSLPGTHVNHEVSAVSSETRVSNSSRIVGCRISLHLGETNAR
eukprot:1351541-Amphidinium_carterae.1